MKSNWYDMVNRILAYVIIAILPVGLIMAGFISNYLHEQELKPKEPPKPEPEKSHGNDGLPDTLFTLLFAGLIIFTIVMLNSRNFPSLVIAIVVGAVAISLGQSIVNSIHSSANASIEPASTSTLIEQANALNTSVGLLVNMVPIIALAVVGGIAVFFFIGSLGKSY